LALILCIDPGASSPGALERSLQEMGHAPIPCDRLADAIRALESGPVELILSASRLSDGTAIDLLDRMRDQQLEIPVIVLIGYASVEDAQAAIRHGALDYVTMPPRAEALRLAVSQALRLTELRRENHDIRRQIETLRVDLAGEVLNLRQLERQAIRRALLATQGHRSRAASLLGISERTLRNKLHLSPELIVTARRGRSRV